MAIPKNREIRKPILEVLDHMGELTVVQLVLPLSGTFSLSKKEIDQEYESGNGNVFQNRISFALSGLYAAELVENTRKAHYSITEAGRNWLQKLDNGFDSGEFEKFIQIKVKERRERTLSNRKEEKQESEYDLNESFEELKNNIYVEIIDTILSKSPQAFEHLVVKLLQKMGYGGTVKDSGKVTQLSNDGGIDGIIKQDVLGFGRIYIQAKRYDRGNSVGRDEIQKFVGALATTSSSKGVFITTSDYSKGATTYAEGISNVNLVLINGNELAKYIYDYGLGMQVEQTLEIKKLDTDFWESMENDK